METLIVIIIVGAAVVWAIRRFSRLLTGKQTNSCGCDCSACGGGSAADRESNDPSVEILESMPKK